MQQTPTNLTTKAPIGIFDSGYGGLTVFRSIVEILPQYDYIYFGDNARAPYGPRPHEEIYQFTLEAVRKLFDLGSPLVILACNTASARALRSIQQHYLQQPDEYRRVLGVIRPTAEVVGTFSRSGKVGVLGTKGTIDSCSYPLEISKFYPELEVFQQSCPMWVPLIEAGKMDSPEADYYIQLYLGQLLAQSPDIDTILLACTHYPLLEEKLKAALPEHITILGQGELVALSLQDYLLRHPEMETRLSKEGSRTFYTSSADTAEFEAHASCFFGAEVEAKKLQ